MVKVPRPSFPGARTGRCRSNTTTFATRAAGASRPPFAGRKTSAGSPPDTTSSPATSSRPSQRLQLAVLVVELLQLLHLSRQQVVVFLFPVEVGCLADPGPAADLHHRDPVGPLLQDERLLRVRELQCLHRSPLRPSHGTLSRKTPIRTVQFAGIRSRE